MLNFLLFGFILHPREFQLVAETPESLDVRIFDNLSSLAGDRHGYHQKISLVSRHQA
ncbi:hypothetical protein H6G45_06735 [Synechocystis sp. FACHB-383]|uniref:hypothetical protein n=1 Tax=unclassified Synechocystis TaxID=2640012 RepID=UPI0016899AED|nr:MULTISPECIES: hypothetical protein [unclassified Synechocystis]MBD2653186.1 hypothetical protein [Synechocystis sp. FACHB-383]MBE9197071.1 hypothetical protein [Synechocystis sp. LEGE 06083]